MGELVLWGLATQRLAFLWFSAAMFKPVKSWLERRNPWLASAVNCPACVSIWAAGTVYGLWHAGWGGIAVDAVLAISAASVFVDLILDRATRK